MGRVTLRKDATVQVKSNLVLTMRERGKIVARRQGHNIWLDLGRAYLAQLICYASYGPPETYQNSARIKYMGLGIGGTRQLAQGFASSPPLSTSYPGGYLNTDTNPELKGMERPVRLSGGSVAYDNFPPHTDVWLGNVTLPVAHPTATQALFRRLFTSTEISYGSFVSVPLSEAGLFTSAASPNIAPRYGQPEYLMAAFVAYDTFDTISKTTAFELEVNWTVRF